MKFIHSFTPSLARSLIQSYFIKLQRAHRETLCAVSRRVALPCLDFVTTMLLAFIQLFYVDVTNILGCKSFVYACISWVCVRVKNMVLMSGWSCCHLKDRTIRIIAQSFSFLLDVLEFCDFKWISLISSTFGSSSFWSCYCTGHKIID